MKQYKILVLLKIRLDLVWYQIDIAYLQNLNLYNISEKYNSSLSAIGGIKSTLIQCCHSKRKT